MEMNNKLCDIGGGKCLPEGGRTADGMFVYYPAGSQPPRERDGEKEMKRGGGERQKKQSTGIEARTCAFFLRCLACFFFFVLIAKTLCVFVHDSFSLGLVCLVDSVRLERAGKNYCFETARLLPLQLPGPFGFCVWKLLTICVAGGVCSCPNPHDRRAPIPVLSPSLPVLRVRLCLLCPLGLVSLFFVCAVAPNARKSKKILLLAKNM